MTDPLPDTAARIAALEGRLIAQRRILMRLLGGLPAESRAGLLDWLEERAVLRDGQEDPGAVPAEGAALELALADEMRLMRQELARHDDRSG
ncbi:hypothetical protein SAMN05421641_10323 [Paracoccus thiocyanatus]|uniref:Uncharacterized protein n=1 Tax=Paracoccus thiocyanatus TaxID=34006 RepID=A0A1N6PI43_9RHOB|nr:hypothetical protein [Paracoccus thiocyanatus]SIQ04030.1 hypothetical protein SAMN05421641_10323 [Paracoccus thiocyanatus]